MKFLKVFAASATLTVLSAMSIHAVEEGFVSLFDGKTFNGWKLMHQHGPGYGITNGILYCAHGGGGNLLSEKEYENFVFRFDFRLEPGSNNGIGLRTPLEGDAAYVAMESQVLDDTTTRYGPLRPEQMHGSIYNVIPAKSGSQKPVGEWNEQEISVNGRHIKIVLNGTTVLDGNINDVKNPALLHQHHGLMRERGHIGFLGHTEYVEFRNVRIKELPSSNKDNTPPEGFKALFNGKDLTGWKGSVGTPPKRAAMSAEALAAAQKTADEEMRAHWNVEEDALVFDGKGKSLATAKDYGNFELVCDWKILTDGDTGIYLRGCPQVQIWDPNSKKGKRDHSVGSGGIHNNETNPNVPSKRADKPIGEWNRFRILMTGDKVTIYLNNELVVHNVTMENSCEKGKPLYPTGPIELQNHGNKLWFKNIYIREL
jgi:hypothetical protein